MKTIFHPNLGGALSCLLLLITSCTPPPPTPRVSTPLNPASDSTYTKERASQEYWQIKVRFNRDLAGHYPFGSTASRDADPDRVCAFFRDFRETFLPLRASLHSDQNDRVRYFLDQLIATDAFLSGNACSGFNSPVRIHFNPSSKGSSTSNPPLIWKLTDGFRDANYPHGIPVLDWSFGSPIALEVTWEQITEVRPRAPTAGDAFELVDSTTIRFKSIGPWALLRFIEAHGGGNSRDRLGDRSVWLSFPRPLISTSSKLSADKIPKRTVASPLSIRLTFENLDVGRQRRPFAWPMFPVWAPTLD
jgi:hypothetical protein